MKKKTIESARATVTFSVPQLYALLQFLGNSNLHEVSDKTTAPFSKYLPEIHRAVSNGYYDYVDSVKTPD